MVEVMKIEAGQYLTSHEVAKLIQANPSSVNNWIRAGKIKAFRTPGGHRRVLVEDLANFLVECNLPMPPALLAASVRRVLWVDPDTRARRAVERRAADNSRIELTGANSLSECLMKIGFVRPHAVVLDARLGRDRNAFVEDLQDWDETASVQVYFADEKPDEDSPMKGVVSVIKRGKIEDLIPEV